MSKSKKMQRDALKRLSRPQPLPISAPEPHEQEAVTQAQAWLGGAHDGPPALVFQPGGPHPGVDYSPAGPEPAPSRVLDSRSHCPPATPDPYASLTTEQRLVTELLKAGMLCAGDAQEAYYDALHGLSTVQKLARRILDPEVNNG